MRPVDAQQGSTLDDFILSAWDFLLPAAAQTEPDASTRALFVIVGVSVSSWPLLKACVQPVLMRPGEQGGRSNDRLDTGQ